MLYKNIAKTYMKAHRRIIFIFLRNNHLLQRIHMNFENLPACDSTVEAGKFSTYPILCITESIATPHEVLN